MATAVSRPHAGSRLDDGRRTLSPVLNRDEGSASSTVPARSPPSIWVRANRPHLDAADPAFSVAYEAFSLRQRQLVLQKAAALACSTMSLQRDSTDLPPPSDGTSKAALNEPHTRRS